MANNSIAVVIDTLRSLAFGGISGTYASVGTALTFPPRIICLTNNTDGDMFFSTNASTNMLFLAAGSFKLFDLNTNRLGLQPTWAFRVGTQFSVKQSTAPSKGAVYIEILG
jgi:hypothetical protein